MASPRQGAIWLALGVALAFTAPPAAAQTAPNPLVGQWHLDDQFESGISTDATSDSSGAGRDLECASGCMQYATPGRFGNYYAADASTGQPKTVPGANHQRVTLIAWINTSGFASNGRVIAGRGIDAVTCENMPYALQLEAGDDGAGTAPVSFKIRRPDGSSVSSPVSGNVVDGAWHMLAGVFDGTSVRLYVDGAQVGTGTPAGTAAIGYGASQSFGIDGYAGSGCSGPSFPGGIDEVREYGRALSPTEIARLASPAATTPPVLVADQPPVQPESPAPGPPIARFEIPDPDPDAYAPITLDAGSSTAPFRIRSYDWDLTGDGRTDVSCDPETPVLTTTTLRPSVRSIALSVVDARGAATTTRRSIAIDAVPIPSRVRTALARTDVSPKVFSGARYQLGLCSPDTQPANDNPNANVPDTTANGGPPAGCLSQVVVGNFKAKGCWRLVTKPEDIPPAQAAQIAGTYADFLFPKVADRVLEIAGRRDGGLLNEPSVNPGLLGPPFRRSSVRARPRARASAGMVEYAYALMYATLKSSFVADGKVRVNGVDLEPQRLAGKVVFVGGGSLATGKATLSASGFQVAANSPYGRLVMKRGSLNETFSVLQEVSPFGALNIDQKLPLVPGLGIKGAITAKMDDYKLKVGANVTLPPPLRVSSAANLVASEENGLELEYFKLHADEAPFGAVILKNLNFEWRGRPDYLLTAGLEARILNKIGAGGTIRFENGGFRSLKVFAEAFPGVVLGPGVHLTRVDAEYDHKGPVIAGAATITLGPNPGGGCPKVGVVGDFKLDFNYPMTANIGGATKLLCFTVASMGASVNEEGYGNFFGRFNPDLSPLPVTFDAKAVGQIQAPINARVLRYQLDASIRGCLDLEEFDIPLSACTKIRSTVSDKGMAVCGKLGPVWAGLGLEPYPHLATLLNPVTFVVTVLDNLTPYVSGCDVGDYQTLPNMASASQAGSRAFTIPAGRRDAVLAFKGRGGAPDLILRGPGGRTIVVPSKGMLRNSSVAAFRFGLDDTTYVMIGKPAPGRWTAELKPGSPAIASGRYAAELPPIRLRASVRKSGSRRVLRYRINRRRGQRVHFVEVAGTKAGQSLGTTSKARGRILFTPADSNTRNRKIVAYVEQGGGPRESFTVARFRASNRRIGRPKLRVRRRKSRLVITWKAAGNAQRYRATVSLSDGRKLFFDRGRRRRRLVIRRVAKKTTGTVSVRGERSGPRFGRKATVKVRAVKAKKKAKKRSKSKRR